MPGRFISQLPAAPPTEVLFSTRPDFASSLEIIADHIVRPAITREASKSMTFAVYGAWGAGKSTAMRVIEELVARRATDEDGATCTFSHYDAPLWETSSDARLSLAQVIVGDIRPEAQALLVHVIRNVLGMGEDAVPMGYEQQLKNTLDFQMVLRQLESLPPILEEWMHLVSSTLNRPEGDEARLHVVFIDDLDRCSHDFTAELLAATTYWSRVENLFFVVAASHEHLLSCMKERLPLGLRYPEDALQKYVHLSVDVPPLLTSPREIGAFLVHVLDEVLPGEGASAERFHELRELIRESAESYDSREGSVLAPLLRPEPRLTPRTVKHRLNRLLSEFRPQAAVLADDVKRWVLVAFWPDFWWRYLWDLELDEPSGPRDDLNQRVAWLQQLVSVGRELRPLWGMEADGLRAALDYLASRRGMTTDVDPELAIYLALEPSWRPPAPIRGAVFSSLLSGELSEGDDEASTDAVDPQLLYYVQAEQAIDRGDRREATGHLEGLLSTTHDRRIRQSAATIGNGALIAEQVDSELAMALHQAAFNADPRHYNVVQNFLEFLLDTSRTDQLPLAEQLLDRLRSEGSGHRPERTEILGLRLDRLKGVPSDAIRDRIEALVARIPEDPSLRRFRALFRLLDEMGDGDLMRRAVQAAMEFISEDNGRYDLLRYLADGLATSSDEADEREATDLYMFFLRSGLACHAEHDEPVAVKHNLASLLRGFDYRRVAALLWEEAYRADPKDARIRRALASVLNSLDLGSAAAAVLLGQQLDALTVEPETLPASFAPDSGEWWRTIPFAEYPPCPSLVTRPSV